MRDHQSTQMMEGFNLPSLLEAAAHQAPSQGLILRLSGFDNSEIKVTYGALLTKARYYSVLLRLAEGYRRHRAVVIHVDSQIDALLWFWATLLADAIPVITPRLSNVQEQREKYVATLDALLEKPIWITPLTSLDWYNRRDDLEILPIETMLSWLESPPTMSKGFWNQQRYQGDAMFMLTSGSTGAPKAVRLGHEQILQAVRGKNSMRELPLGKPFLNWIRLDHVASLVEIHLTAMQLGVDQVLVEADDIVSDPIAFLDLLCRHEVARTFAPNFFLAKLAQTMQNHPNDPRMRDLKLHNLTWLGSGGEANDVSVCENLSQKLAKYGARVDAIVPGFGMTETCAGIVYHLQCPEYDIRRCSAFTSLGKCIPGVEIRVTHDVPDEGGDLEVRGPVVFQGYYNNESATVEAFRPGHWFRTGDKAMIDPDGNLHLVGRTKETMIINGIKHFPHDIENLLTRVLDTRVTHTVCFSYRPVASATESICVICVLKGGGASWPQAIADTRSAIVQNVMLHTGAMPTVLLLDSEELLQMSSIGKTSRSKLRILLEAGALSKQIDAQSNVIQQWVSGHLDSQFSETERALLTDLKVVLGIEIENFEPTTSIFASGVNSMDIIRLKTYLEGKLRISIPVTVLLVNSTVRMLAVALRQLEGPREYNPVVVLKTEGSKTPLWLVHPGIGEILVFLGLTKHMDERPLYALRARGFDGEPHFTSTDDVVATYVDAIKKQQPQGPYAIAGYSFGAMLAFEIAKHMTQRHQDEVRFLGSFNLPPHIQDRVRQLSWNECLLHLCYFLGLFSEQTAQSLSPEIAGRSRDEALDRLLDHVDRERLRALSIDESGLKSWANLSHDLHRNAIDYQPSGSVDSIDVFIADPLTSLQCSRPEWEDRYLSAWADFSRTAPRFHHVQGEHYTMLDEANVESFSKKLKLAMEDRNL